MNDVIISPAGENIFEDLGFGKEEAAELRQRSMLMIKLTRHLRAEQRTQKELGKTLGIAQSRVSDLMKGKAQLFSLEMLIRFAARLGMNVEIDIRPPVARAAARRIERIADPHYERIFLSTATWAHHKALSPQEADAKAFATSGSFIYAMRGDYASSARRRLDRMLVGTRNSASATKPTVNLKNYSSEPVEIS